MKIKKGYSANINHNHTVTMELRENESVTTLNQAAHGDTRVPQNMLRLGKPTADDRVL